MSWNTIVKVFPTWLAPSLTILSGLLLIVFNFLLISHFDPDFYASAPGHKHVPGWVWMVVSILNFIAYTLDGVDGKQAYRTNSSAPLQELFDHGLEGGSCLLCYTPSLGKDHLVSVFCSLSPTMGSFVFFHPVPLGKV